MLNGSDRLDGAPLEDSLLDEKGFSREMELKSLKSTVLSTVNLLCSPFELAFC